MDLKNLGQQIKQARKEEGLTQAELALKIGSAEQNISRIEAGRQNITFGLLESIATALNRKITEQILIKADRPDEKSK